MNRSLPIAKFLAFAFVVACLIALPTLMFAQTLVTGDITGTVTDPTGAVVSGAKLTLKSPNTGVSEAATTNASGLFRFALVKPGDYKLTISQSGFRSTTETVTAALGQITTVNVKLEIGTGSEIVEVTGTVPLVQSENGNIATNVSQELVNALPNGGNDITFIAQMAPGVTMNTSSGNGYGNFVAFGLPATSNLFTVNGNDEMDPYLNLNNSGATNLLLGKNEVQEVAVVSNGYTGQYGRMAGAQVDYATKSGTNGIHGNLDYQWNGRALNANDWFLKSSQLQEPVSHNDAPFVNNNQWAASIGGPIKKDKAFFFVDTEGIRYILATSQQTIVPNAGFASAVEANLAVVDPLAVPFYTNIFNLYTGAPGYGSSTPDTQTGNGGCGNLTVAAGIGGYGSDGLPCANDFRSSVGSPSNEWTLATRADFTLTQKDKLFLRYKSDRGTQPTSSDPVNPLFSATSFQPQWEAQVNYTRVINPTTINQFVGSGSWYQAIFNVNNRPAALAAFPYFLIENESSSWASLGASSAFPQGRKVTQYQLSDDLSLTRGSHELKLGGNFRRNDISDYWFGRRTIPQTYLNHMTQFVNGETNRIRQYFPANGGLGQPVAIYSVGFYLQDTWRAKSNLKFTMTLRADRNSNMVCQTNCISNLIQPFEQSPHDVNAPFNQLFVGGQHSMFQGGIEKVVFQPRFGFAWNPGGKSDLVIRGGVGLFSDLYPATLVDSFATNAPGFDRFTIRKLMPLSPADAGNAESIVQGCQTAFQGAYSSGGTAATYVASDPNCVTASGNPQVPDYTSAGKIQNPKFLEWNVELQKSLGTKSSFSINYVGNRGYDIFMSNSWANASAGQFCTFTGLPGGETAFGCAGPGAPDTRLGNVTSITNAGYSNYNGLVASFTRRITKGFQGQINYTWSHAMDTVSNGGLLPFSQNDSVLTQLNPGNLRINDYSNADYDVRHNLTASYVWNLPLKASNRGLDAVIGGWSLSGTVFARSGLPFTVTDALPSLGGIFTNGLNTDITAQYVGGPTTCSRPSASGINPATGLPTACLDAATQFPANFNVTETGFSTTRRNSFRGPHYFNSDFSIMKKFKVTERASFAVGATAYNVFNHPNFANPNSDVNEFLSAPFGTITQTITPPTSIYGAFFGSAVSGRLLQLHARIEF